MKKLLKIISGISSLINGSKSTEELIQMQTQDFKLCLQTIIDELTIPKEKIKQIQNERLKALLRHAKSNSTWYKKTLAKIDVENFNLERLPEIPPINKKTLMDNWDLFVTNPKLSLELVEKHLEKMSQDENTLYLLNRYHVLATSKTTGRHGVFVYDWNEWNRGYARFVRYRLYRQDMKKIFAGSSKKIKIVQIIVCNPIYAVYAIAKSFKLDEIERYFLPVTLPINEIVVGLNSIQPDVLQGTPSTIYKICQEARAKRLHIEPKIIDVSGEVLYKPMRNFIKTIWPNINLFNTYGSCEGISAVNCRANTEQMHLNEDACIVEPLDQNYNPVPKGTQASKLYLTNLGYFTLPLIRYEMSDKIRFLDKDCDCGINYQLIDEPQGRLEYDFVYPDNIFAHHLLFVTPLLFEKNIIDYQVIQTKNGADLKILTCGFVDKDKLKANISMKLANLGLANPDVRVFEVAKFDFLPSGKLRRFIKME